MPCSCLFHTLRIRYNLCTDYYLINSSRRVRHHCFTVWDKLLTYTFTYFQQCCVKRIELQRGCRKENLRLVTRQLYASNHGHKSVFFTCFPRNIWMLRQRDSGWYCGKGAFSDFCDHRAWGKIFSLKAADKQHLGANSSLPFQLFCRISTIKRIMNAGRSLYFKMSKRCYSCVFLDTALMNLSCIFNRAVTHEDGC